MEKKYHIILSSNSPRRKELLAGLDIDFEIYVIKGINETYPQNIPVTSIAEYIATEKANAYSILLNDENLIILENSQAAILYRNFFEYLWKKIPDKWLRGFPRAEGLDSIGSCSDGLDNDYDGLIDGEDEGCKK